MTKHTESEYQSILMRDFQELQLIKLQQILQQQINEFLNTMYQQKKN